MLALFRRVAHTLGWTRASYYLMSLFMATVLLIIVVWWPLAEDYLAQINPDYPIWMQFDWLLLGIFLAMSLLIMAGANFKADSWIVFVGLCGGLVIESWGTQTEIWVYYTAERPPLWIIPAWPIASLSIDRIVRLIDNFTSRFKFRRTYQIAYWLIFPAFYVLMLVFVWPTMDKPLTWMALLLSLLMILTPTDSRLAVITFAAGSGLGYFLERWGTTRLCWTYYTLERPPVFAVFAHGLAAVAFWRSWTAIRLVYAKSLSHLRNTEVSVIK
jgi:hypothetical protein